ncbi:V-type ATP synthase subunit I [Exilibacterium tricleocarpae]|uniref:V-type ATP synthase subunit I n=1 Tax=Exilibacterium tricleocarpae TaxID=2591008 RepID=A0A545SZ08_9GAMM|nr:V-type ATP synthase subunit I [Exilibacterium tricleocarpae]TQV70203.1 V-type ATP synthase subunit I [Exilibacterium tricleocarpae]
MSIAAQMRMTLLGPLDQKAAIVEALQRLGVAHLIAPPGAHPEVTGTAAGVRRLRQARDYLQGATHRRRLFRPRQPVDIEALVERVLANRRARGEVIDRIEALKQHYRALRPWGDFHYPALSELDGYRLWFYRLPLHEVDPFKDLRLPWARVSTDHRYQYLIVIAEDEAALQEIPFPRSHTGGQSLSQVREQLDIQEARLEEIEIERVTLTRWIYSFDQGLAALADSTDLREALDWCEGDREFFSLRCWVPADRVEQLQPLRDLGAAWSLEPATGADNPPTLLRNRRPFDSGSDLIGFFQVPGYHSLDASAAMFLSFSLFFAVILADAGYAAVVGVVLWPLRQRLGRRLRQLGVAMVAAGIGYGVLVGSYFGLTPAPQSLPGQLRVLDINDFDSMIKLSITVGVSHLLLAHCMRLWHLRSSLAALGPLGWMLVISGGFLAWWIYIGAVTGEAAVTAATAAVVFGALGILLFSNPVAVTDWRTLLQRLGAGFTGLYGISRAFSDILSYIRLFALGLASASLAVTFNQLAATAQQTWPGYGLLLAFLVLLIGHGLNFILAIMGGVIHSLRLNLLEFNNWAVEGEGYPFRFFNKREES